MRLTVKTYEMIASWDPARHSQLMRGLRAASSRRITMPPLCPRFMMAARAAPTQLYPNEESPANPAPSATCKGCSMYRYTESVDWRSTGLKATDDRLLHELEEVYGPNLCDGLRDGFGGNEDHEFTALRIAVLTIRPTTARSGGADSRRGPIDRSSGRRNTGTPVRPVGGHRGEPRILRQCSSTCTRT